MTTTSRASASERYTGGKTRLDRAVIVTAGIELAAEEGVSSILIRDLGRRLGTDPTAIYRHFLNKEQLMKALLDELISRSVAAVSIDPASWQERIRALALATLSEFSRHPAIGAEAVVLTTQGAGELRGMEYILDAFSYAGLTGEQLIRHYAMLAFQMLSAAGGIARARNERGGDTTVASAWFDGPLVVDKNRFPLVAEHASQIARFSDEDLFMLGVDEVIRSAEQAAADRSTP